MALAIYIFRPMHFVRPIFLRKRSFRCSCVTLRPRLVRGGNMPLYQLSLKPKGVLQPFSLPILLAPQGCGALASEL